jgi:hypothetical protein
LVLPLLFIVSLFFAFLFNPHSIGITNMNTPALEKCIDDVMLRHVVRTWYFMPCEAIKYVDSNYFAVEAALESIGEYYKQSASKFADAYAMHGTGKVSEYVASKVLLME